MDEDCQDSVRTTMRDYRHTCERKRTGDEDGFLESGFGHHSNASLSSVGTTRKTAAKDNPGKWGYADKRGDITIPPVFDWATSFCEGFACVLSGNLAGYIDRMGDWVILPLFDGGREFSEGLAPVMRAGLWGFFDRKGHIVIEAQFEDALPFDHGAAGVEVKGGNPNPSTTYVTVHFFQTGSGSPN
jgi:hypothetical protein